MKLKKIITLFLISLTCFTGINSFARQRPNETKPDQYRAVHWGMEDGLGWDFANLMIKDANGFMWFGTQWGGLCRFDGAVFEKMIFDKNIRNAINSDGIMGFVEDSLHNIWIGTKYELSRYDIRADTFTNFVKAIDSIHYKRSAVPFWSTRDYVYCMETDRSIVSYNIHSLARRTFFTLTDTENIRVGGVTLNHTILDEASHCLWMLELYDQNEDRGGLLRVSLDDGKRQRYTWPCYSINSGHRHSAIAMRLDRKRNSIWLNSGDGLLEFSLDNKQFHKVNALSEFVKLKDYDRNLGIDIDREGRIWLTTVPKGILIYDPETNFAQQLFSDPDLLKKTGEGTDLIYCDRDGIVWTSYWAGVSGIYELLPFNPPVKRYAANAKLPDSLSSGIIFSIVPAAKGKLWIGTRDGLNIFDPATEKFAVLRKKELPGIRGTVIVPIYIDTIRQKAWLNAGLNEAGFETKTYEMDIRTRRCRPIVFRDQSKQFVTSSHNYANFFPYKDGLMLVDDNLGLFEMKWDSLSANLLIPFRGAVGGGAIEDDQFMFFQRGGYEPNLSFENKDGKWKRIPHLLDNLDWSSMLYYEKDQTHWVSLPNELVHYDKAFRKIKAYGQEEGYTGPIYNMQKDNAGNLWFSNILDQIGRLNISTGLITTISETDGIQKPNFDWFAPGAKDANGNIYFGSGGWVNENVGLYRIQPERYASAPASSVYLRSLAINRKQFSLSTGINNLEELSLQHNQNIISIETGIIDYYAKGKGRLRYKLEREGKHEDWQYAPAYYTIRYDGLAPGSYRLVMQSSNASNEFNGLEKILMIHIIPPFWETWWFRILTAILAIALIYGIIQYRSRSLRKQNVQLEEKVTLRTKELKHSLEELSATQAQLIQSEKMASLGELTAGIAHEIQNPLNFVNNFSEVSNELIDEMKDEMQKGNYTDAEEIANDIKQNLEKINHHGKRADAIVKGMLQHSQKSSGAKESTDINALADEYLTLAYHGLKAKDNSFNATMKTDFDNSIEKINIIQQDIARVLLNLYNNAFYAVNEKAKQQPAEGGYEPTVSVSTYKMVDKVEIKVSDNGNGIPQKILDKIFQPFFTTKPTGQGTGLGLSLSYDIIKAHGGEIKVETKEGEASEFIIYLPIK